MNDESILKLRLFAKQPVKSLKTLDRLNFGALNYKS